MSGLTLDKSLRDFCETDRQRQFFDAVVETGSYAGADRKLGVAPDSAGRVMRKLRAKAAKYGKAGDAHHNSGVAEGYFIKNTTIHRDAEGNVIQSWERQHIEQQKVEEVIRDFVDTLMERKELAAPILPKPYGFQNDDLLAVYPMGDPHLGMVAYAEECGEDFNLDTACADIEDAFDQLIASAPPAKHALIAELGDFFHSDNEQNRTARSGNSLDADRWARVQQRGLALMVSIVEKVATKHEFVTVRIVRGNHDTHGSYALSLALELYFRNNPRITVAVSANAHWYYQFGKVLIGLTHGDTSKQKDLGGIMSVDCEDVWSATKFRYWYHGHIHNKQMREQYGCLIESFRTLAGKDAWHSAEGYRSGQDMHMICHHREFGEVIRTRADVKLVRAMRLAHEAKKEAA